LEEFAEAAVSELAMALLSVEVLEILEILEILETSAQFYKLDVQSCR